MSCEYSAPTSPVDLRGRSDLLRQFDDDVQSAGLVGEKENAKIVLLAAVSAKLQRPLNLTVGGASSAGKNHLTGTVAKFLPDESKKVITGMSPKALMHSGEDEFQHKAVFIAEYEGVSGADYAIRTMQSEQQIEYEFVDSSDDGLTKKRRKIKGPVAFIQATTRSVLHPENETRMLFLEIDESEEQTRSINRRQAQEAERKTSPCPPELYARWHRLLRSLKQSPIRIPFATQLAEALPARVRSRRDLPKLLGLIEASAYLHQHRRGRDEQGNIVASPEDYQIARTLFEHCYYTGPESKVGELIAAAEKFSEKDFSAADLIRATGWGKTKTYTVLNRAEELGNIAEGDRRGRYRLIHNRSEAPLNLPQKIRLKAGDFHISAEATLVNFRYSDFPQHISEGPPNGKTEDASQEYVSDEAASLPAGLPS